MRQVGLLNKITSRQFIIAVVAAMLVITSFISSMVSAEALSTRSITPTSLAVNATGVDYVIRFTPETTLASGAVVIDFCNSASGPLLGQSCTEPTAINVGTATVTGGTKSAHAVVDTNTMVVSKAMTADVEQEITLTGVTNPSATGVAYARIVTYASLAHAEGYQSDDPDNGGAVVDSGSVALYFNNSIHISGTVLETMTFCVSGAAIEANCSGASAPAAIVLGEEVSTGVYALVPGTISTGTLHTQINTNAANGVVIRLKSSAACGGLVRAGSDVCDIAPALDDDVVDNDNSARFGVMTADSTNATGAANPSGVFLPYSADPENPAPFYLTTRYSFNYDDLNPTTVGVTSAFGDPFLYTANAPATGKNMELTFGATASTNTPAGTYSTDLSLIAVGKF